MAVIEKLTYRPGDIEINNFLLYNYRKSVVDIRHLMVEFSIYHDLFTNGTKCEIVLADANGLVEMLPIVGDEVFVLSFRTPTFDDILTYVFQIYSVTNKNKAEPRSEAYVLHGISQEVISNMRKSINKSYKDLPISTVVKGIYNSFLKPTEEEYRIIKINRVLEIEETLDNCHIVFPGEKPFKAIQYLCQEAQAKNTDASQASNFIFFEKNSGWYFKTIDSMLSADPVENFYFTEASFEVFENRGDKIHQYQMITNIEFINQFDTLARLNSGYYSHTIETIDPILKKFTSDVFVYENDFSKIGHIENAKNSFGTNFAYSENSLFATNAGSSVKYFLPSHIGENYSRLDYLNPARDDDPQIRNPRRLHKFMKYDVVSRLQLENIVLSISIPGNTEIEIGDIVNLHIPQSTENKDFMNSLNLLYDRRFFVTAVRHTYNKTDNNFFTVFECVKDTYGKKVVEV
jgi:hypothetical protein